MHRYELDPRGCQWRGLRCDEQAAAGTNRVGAASAWPAANPVVAQALSRVGSQICNVRGDALQRRHDVTPAGKSSAFRQRIICWGSTLPGPCHSGRGFSCFKPFPRHFRPFSAGWPKREEKERPPSLPRQRATGRAGRKRARAAFGSATGPSIRFDPFEFKSSTAPISLYTVCSSQIACPRFKQTRGSFSSDTLSHLSDRGYAADQHREPRLGHDAARLHGPRLCGIARQGRAARRSLHSPLIDRALVLASGRERCGRAGDADGP